MIHQEQNLRYTFLSPKPTDARRIPWVMITLHINEYRRYNIMEIKVAV